MQLLLGVQNLVALVLGVTAFAVEVFALVHAARQRPDAFVAAGKLTKKVWLLILGVCALVGFVSLWNVLSLFGLLAIVGAGVYLADVRPAIAQVLGRARANRW